MPKFRTKVGHEGRRLANISPPMPSAAELKRVRSLQQKKYRDREGAFLVEGLKGVEELLRSDLVVEAVYSTAKAAGLITTETKILPAKELNKLRTVSSDLVMLAVARIPKEKQPKLSGHDLFLALDGINDPGNLGTILRVADWFGVQAVLVGEGTVDPYNPKCVRSSMGSMFRVPVMAGPLVPRLRELKENGFNLFKAKAGGTSIYETNVQLPAVIMLGSESHGISAKVEAEITEVLSIPSFGKAESLNVAMAATALCTVIRRP